MTEEKYSLFFKQKVKSKAFNEIINKKSNRDFKKHIFYTQLELASYLQENYFGYFFREKQYIFQCRMNDIDVKANRSWKYQDLTFKSCITNKTETQEHILLCNALLKINTKLTYLPQYSDLYSRKCDKWVKSKTVRWTPPGLFSGYI